MDNLIPWTPDLHPQGLCEKDLADCPLSQLEDWMLQALRAEVAYPFAMVLATVGESGRPDQRLVLLKHIGPDGLIFFTADTSKKVHDAGANHLVSGHFPLHAMDRQVRVAGALEKISAAETTHYLVSPNEQAPEQPGDWDYKAGHSISSRRVLLQQFQTMKSKFHGGGERQPCHWSGYRLVPDYFEFWQGGGPRLRDRFAYVLSDGNWRIEQIEA